MRAYVFYGIAAGAVAVAVALACGASTHRAVFTYARHPDFPRTAYLSGKLGVIQPSYARSYLAIAYRYLSDRPLTLDERAQVREYWKDRATGHWDRTAVDWTIRWKSARSKVTQIPATTVSNDLVQGRYAFDARTNAFSLNCAEDAYRTAHDTLLERGKRFGFHSLGVRSWLAAQDQVFENCDGEGEVPKQDSSLPAVFRADRDYQIAAAHFYLNHYSQAVAGFRKISNDAQSPWRRIAPYLVVRSLAREGSNEAEAEARAVLANKSLAHLHGMTRVLLQRVVLKRLDEDYFHSLANDLVRGGSVRSWRESLWDYTTMYDRFEGDTSVLRRDDLSDWIHTYQSSNPKAGAHAVSRWRATGRLPWLIAALLHASVDDPAAIELMTAASALPADHPGYVMASFFRLRLMMDSRQAAAARTEIDGMLQVGLPKSTENLFRSLRMRGAPDLTEFLRFAPRMPVMLTTSENQGETPDPQRDREQELTRHAKGKMLYDTDSIKLLNEATPLRVLRDAALSGHITAGYEGEFALSVFTRALLLNEIQIALQLAAKLRDTGMDKSGYLRAFFDAADPGSRRFAGVYYILHHPEARPYAASGMGRGANIGSIDAFRDNWWCPVDMQVELDARTSIFDWSEGPAPRAEVDSARWTAAFLTDAERQEAKREMRKLAETQSGPDFLIAETMKYAQAHPKDPRVPEALHYALRSQRYGCVRDETAIAAEKAWRFMWRHYPKHPWTPKSNYPFQTNNVPRPRGSY